MSMQNPVPSEALEKAQNATINPVEDPSDEDNLEEFKIEGPRQPNSSNRKLKKRRCLLKGVFIITCAESSEIITDFTSKNVHLLRRSLSTNIKPIINTPNDTTRKDSIPSIFLLNLNLNP